MTKELNGQAMLVLGAGRGIGQACARLMAQRGAAVGVADLNNASVDETIALIRQDGGTADGYVLDAGQRDAVLAAAQDMCLRHGHLDAIAASAMWIRYEPVEAIRDETIDRMMSVGLKSVLWSAQAALECMDPAREGRSLLSHHPWPIGGTEARRSIPQSKGGWLP